MRIRFALVSLMLAIGLAGFAQSNAEVDALLAQEQARVDSAAYMVLVAAGQIGEDSSPADAFAALQEKGWISAKAAASDPIAADAFCALVMRSLGLKGGLMYRLFPGPRYAYRDFVSRGFLDPSGGPKRTLPGDEVMKIMRQAMDLKGGGQ